MRWILIALGLYLGVVNTAVAQDDSPVLKRIKERGTVTIGDREGSVPFSYIGPDGKPIGFAIDICLAIVDKIKATLKAPDLKVNFVPVTGANRIPLIANGTIDMECGSTAVTLDRMKQVGFLPITFVTGLRLLVKKNAGIHEIEDMNGKSIGVTLGTTEDKFVRQIIAEKHLDTKVVNVKEHTEGGLALQTDRIDAYITDDVLLYGLISQSKDPDQLDVVGRILYYDPYSIMIPRNDDSFRLLGTAVLADMMRSGDMVKLYNKWFVGKGTVNMPLSDIMKAAYQIEALNY